MKYIHIIKPNIKHIYIKVDKDNNVILTSSKKMKKEALKVLEDKKDWIQKVKAKNALRPKRDNIYKNEGIMYFFGQKFLFLNAIGKKDSISFDGKTLFYHSKFHTNPQKAVERFYKKELEQYIALRIGYYSQKMSLYPKGVKFRKMKRRLGSCSYDNILTFNTMLAKLSFNEIDYVIVHELAHIKHKNHSKKFWAEVSKIFPNYKEIRKSITL